MKITFDGEKVTVEEQKKKDNRFYRIKTKIKDGKPIKETAGKSTIDDFSFEERFGWPEKLSMQDADEDGIQNLVNAIVKSVVDDILNYEIILLNKGHDMYDKYNRKIPPEAIKKMAEIADKAKRDLYRPEFGIYLGYCDPDSIMRRIRPEAIRIIRQYKDNKAKNLKKEKEDGRQDENS